MTDTMFVVTIEWINAHATPAGGWTRKQLEQIGVAWPPLHGWKRRSIGTQITHERRRVFESLGGQEKGRDGMRACKECGGEIGRFKRETAQYCSRACNEKARWTRKMASGFTSEGRADLSPAQIDALFLRAREAQKRQRQGWSA